MAAIGTGAYQWKTLRGFLRYEARAQDARPQSAS